MQIRVDTNELEEFNVSLKKIKGDIDELNILMDRVMGKVIFEKIISDPAVVSDVEQLSEEIKDLSFDLDAYIYDINLIKDEFINLNQKLKDNSTELKNMIQDMLSISKNSFVPATFSINASISSEENESAMKAFGVNEKINQTIELSKYRDLS